MISLAPPAIPAWTERKDTMNNLFGQVASPLSTLNYDNTNDNIGNIGQSSSQNNNNIGQNNNNNNNIGQNNNNNNNIGGQNNVGQSVSRNINIITANNSSNNQKYKNNHNNNMNKSNTSSSHQSALNNNNHNNNNNIENNDDIHLTATALKNNNLQNNLQQNLNNLNKNSSEQICADKGYALIGQPSIIRSSEINTNINSNINAQKIRKNDENRPEISPEKAELIKIAKAKKALKLKEKKLLESVEKKKMKKLVKSLGMDAKIFNEGENMRNRNISFCTVQYILSVLLIFYTDYFRKLFYFYLHFFSAYSYLPLSPSFRYRA